MELTSSSLLDRLHHAPAQEDWQRFVALYEPFIRRFIRLDASMAADAEDICQEVLQKISRKLALFNRQRDGSFRTWLKTITVNEVRLFWRLRQRVPVALANVTDVWLADLADPNNELSRQWDREHANHVLTRLQELIEPEFTPQSWAAFRLRVFESRPSAEVAAMLGMSANAVDVAKSKILSRLRHESAGLLDELD